MSHNMHLLTLNFDLVLSIDIEAAIRFSWVSYTEFWWREKKFFHLKF